MTVLSTIREDPPPPLIYRLIPRADAWLAKGENTTRGRFVLRHTQFPSHRDGWQARDNAFVTPPFFFFPFAALTMENTADVFPLCMQSDVSGPVFYRQRGERLQPHCRNTSVGDGCVFRLVVPLSQPQRKPEHGPTTREEKKRSLLGCHSCVYIVMCSESGACYDHIAGENIQFIPQRLLLQSKCWFRSISSSSTLVEMKISSQLSDRLLWSSVQTFDRERLALVLVIPRLFFTHLHNYLAACYEMYCNALTHDQIPTETQSNHHEWINAGTCLFLHVRISILCCLAALMVRLCSGNKIHFIALRDKAKIED